ncbi:MAG: cytochrome c biogenesis protein CcsA [Myxococcota bacterium]|nr:cytochrome c biogenesis protein CcsA [Myxococcota bacterium]
MIRASGILLALFFAATTWLVATAPTDSMQGAIQKILYVHVPCAFAAYAGFIVTGVSGALYLWRRDERFDWWALAGAEVGVVFCTLNIASGPIWARGTWGHWWAWDPRLTVTLILWFIYLAYLMLRSFTEGSERTARFAAVYGILALAAIPLNYYAIDLFGGAAMHPENLERDSLGAGMRLPFAASVLTGLIALWHLVTVRQDIARRHAEVPEITG